MNQTVTVQHDSGGNPNGYNCANGTGAACPVGLGVKATDAAAEAEPVA